MSHNIKQLKPQVNSRYKQGYINPDSCKKLLNKTQPVIYRSSYERKFITWLESCKQVKKWASESISISYCLPDGSKHNYYPDYYIETTDNKKYIIEIKPSDQTYKPLYENTWLYREWMKNCCKWEAAKSFCQKNGLEFKILTENTINKLH